MNNQHQSSSKSPEERRDEDLLSYLEDIRREVTSAVRMAKDEAANGGAAGGRKKFPPRVRCCGTKLRSLYCHECCRLLLPTAANDDEGGSGGGSPGIGIPPCVLDGSLRLPFDLDVVLHDRRSSATGLHAVALLGDGVGGMNGTRGGSDDLEDCNGTASRSKGKGRQGMNRNNGDVDIYDLGSGITLKCAVDHPPDRGAGVTTRITLVDYEGGAPIPDYSPSSSDGNGDGCGTTKTCVLFPSPGESIPLSDVVPADNTNNKSKFKLNLIVLDCKWTRTNTRLHPSLSHLTKVHLSSPPKESHYWRYHSEGVGMVSTSEAVYHAAWEVLECQKRSLQQLSLNGNGDSNGCGQNIATSGSTGGGRHKMEHELLLSLNEEQRNLRHLLYLFGIQRAMACIDAEASGRPVPYGAEGKESQRELRRRIGTAKHVRDLEIGRRRKAEAAAARAIASNLKGDTGSDEGAAQAKNS